MRYIKLNTMAETALLLIKIDSLINYYPVEVHKDKGKYGVIFR